MNHVYFIATMVSAPRRGGDDCVLFRVATRDTWMNDQGMLVEQINEHNCRAYGDKAKWIHSEVRKNDLVEITGRIRSGVIEGSKMLWYFISITEFNFYIPPKAVPSQPGRWLPDILSEFHD